jgi:hypothetical protein
MSISTTEALAKPIPNLKPISARPSDYWAIRRAFWKHESARHGTDWAGVLSTLREVMTWVEARR